MQSKKRGVKRAPPPTAGEGHICTETACQLYLHTHDKTCPITGIHYAGFEVSSYDKHDYRTWKSGNATTTASAQGKVKKRRGKIASEETLEERATNMIRLLLFSNARMECNRDALKDMQSKADQCIETYTRKQLLLKQQPFYTDVYRFKAAIMSEPLPLTIFEPSTSLIAYYAAVILQIWKLVQTFYVPLKDKKYDEQGIEIVPRLNFDHVALAILYMMRQGIQHMGVEILPRDEFLLQHLPGANYLSYFKLEKSGMSKGERIISNAFENAPNAKALCLNIEALPVHHADEQKIVRVEGYNVEAKVSSSGQLLFMPKSRLSGPQGRKEVKRKE